MYTLTPMYDPFHMAINSVSQLQTLQTHSSHLSESAVSDHKEASLSALQLKHLHLHFYC